MCSSRFSVSEEHLTGPSMSVCRTFHHTITPWSTLEKMILAHILTTMTLNRTVATITSHTIVEFGTIVALVIPLTSLLTSSLVMWRKEHVLNFSVLPSSFCTFASFDRYSCRSFPKIYFILQYSLAFVVEILCRPKFQEANFGGKIFGRTDRQT
jgi:hypothetical protein